MLIIKWKQLIMKIRQVKVEQIIVIKNKNYVINPQDHKLKKLQGHTLSPNINKEIQYHINIINYIKIMI